MEVYLLVLFAYLLGSVPTGYILGSVAGVDVRKAGSGNVGAPNVARVVGKRHGIFTLVADIAKGFVPVVVALHLGLTSAATVVVATAIATAQSASDRWWPGYSGGPDNSRYFASSRIDKKNVNRLDVPFRDHVWKRSSSRTISFS